jgi:hypothetical protein
MCTSLSVLVEIDRLKKLKRLEVYGQKASDFKEVKLLIIGIIKTFLTLS